MSYVAIRFDTDAASADEWGDILVGAGALSVDIGDPHAGTSAEEPRYDEPGEPPAGLWAVSRLTALFRNESSLLVASTALAEAGRILPPHETLAVADEDWVRATQAQFTPIRIDDRLWIVPTWCEAIDSSAINIALDPGIAFGTGSHPTTRLCLRWLARELRTGESVLDYGCGSGILAIAACRLGAEDVFGTDIDPQALEAARANAKRNSVAASFVAPDQLRGVRRRRFDVVVANILANPLIALASELASRLHDGGRIVLSGILEAQADAVMTAYRRWFNIAVFANDEGWIALAGVRRAGQRVS